MAFEFPYHESPFSGFPIGMGHHPHGLPNLDHQFAHFLDMADAGQDLTAPGNGAGSLGSLQVGERQETKPRLAKEEVSRLERIFNENHKPNSNIKRRLAEEMRVEVARINNWFQNRRAKAKQEKKQVEFERAQQAEQQEQSKTPSSQEDTSIQQPADLLPTDFNLQERSGSFSAASVSSASVSGHPHYDDPTTATLESYDRAMDAARAAAQSGAFAHELDSAIPTPRVTLQETGLDDGSGIGRARFPSDAMDLQDLWAEGDLADAFLLQQPQQFQAEVDPPMEQNSGLDSVMQENELNNVGSLGTLLPSQLLSPGHPQATSQDQTDFVGQFDVPEFPIKAEADSEAQPQPDSQMRFKIPPSSINIAARRSKPRPAALGTTPRSNSYVGPKTHAHSPTVARAAGSPLSPRFMRRIMSTTNLNSYAHLNGSRIQKSYPASAQRSPINLHGFADAKAFLDTNAHNIKPATTGSPPTMKNMHPPTPLSPQEFAQLQREMTSSSSSSDDANLLCNGNLAPEYFASEFGDSNLSSPPATPALPFDVQSNHWSSYSIPDEPLHTPGNAAFGADLQPYIPASLPNTPGLPSYLAAGLNYPYPSHQFGFQASANNSNEHLFPRFGSSYMKSSPESSKEFMFQNHTAKDYEASK